MLPEHRVNLHFSPQALCCPSTATLRTEAQLITHVNCPAPGHIPRLVKDCERPAVQVPA